MKSKGQKPIGVGSALPAQQIPLEQLKQVVGGVSPARNPVTMPMPHPPT
jgi:hypothetical protein